MIKPVQRARYAAASMLAAFAAAACGGAAAHHEDHRTTAAAEARSNASADAVAGGPSSGGAAPEVGGTAQDDGVVASGASAGSAPQTFEPGDGSRASESGAAPPPERFAATLYFAAPSLATPAQVVITEINPGPRGGAEAVPGLKAMEKSGFALGATVVVSFEEIVGAPVDASASLVIAAANGSARRVIALPRIYQPMRPTLAPDESAVAFEGRDASFGIVDVDSSIYVVDLATTAIRTASYGGDDHAPVWFPISRRLAYVSYDLDFGTVDLDVVEADFDGTYVIASGAGGGGIAIAPDESEILVASTGETLVGATLAPGRELAALFSSEAASLGFKGFKPTAAIYAPDGTGLALAGTFAAAAGAENAAIVRVGRDGKGMEKLLGPTLLPSGAEGNATVVDAFFNWRP